MQLAIVFLSIILSLLLLFPALACTRRRTFHVHRATATVTAATCSGSGEVSCDLVLSYTLSVGAHRTELVTGVELSTEGDSFAVGNTLTVYYDPEDFRHVSLYPIRPSDEGSYMLLIGAVLILTLPFLFEK